MSRAESETNPLLQIFQHCLVGLPDDSVEQALMEELAEQAYDLVDQALLISKVRQHKDELVAKQFRGDDLSENEQRVLHHFELVMEVLSMAASIGQDYKDLFGVDFDETICGMDDTEAAVVKAIAQAVPIHVAKLLQDNSPSSCRLLKKIDPVLVSPVLLEQFCALDDVRKFRVYLDMTMYDDSRTLLNQLHKHLLMVGDSFSDSKEHERFLLYCWSQTHDVLVKEALLLIDQPQYLATLELQLPDLADRTQQNRLLALVESGSDVAELYLAIKQPRLLLLAQDVSVVMQRNEPANTLLDCKQRLDLFVKRGETQADNLSHLEAYIEQANACEPRNTAIYRLSVELYQAIAAAASTTDLNSDIALYKDLAQRNGDIGYFSEVQSFEPEVLLDAAIGGDQTAVLILHVLAGIPISDSDVDAVAEANAELFAATLINPDLQRTYREKLIDCYMDGFSVLPDIAYAYQLSKDLPETALTIRVKASWFDSDASLDKGYTVAPDSDELYAFQISYLRSTLLNIGCSLKTYARDGEEIAGLMVNGEAVHGASTKDVATHLSGHLADYLVTDQAKNTVFTADELRQMHTSVHRNAPFVSEETTTEGVLQRLCRGEIVSVASGWRKEGSNHAIRISFKKIGNEYYMMYANSGRSALGFESGITLYRVDNPTLLASADFIQSIKTGSADRDHIESHDRLGELGLGRDLQLSRIGFVAKKKQKYGNCAAKSAKNEQLIHLMFMQLQKQFDASSQQPTADMFTLSHLQSSRWMKKFIAYSRQRSLHDALVFCSPEYPAHIDQSQYVVVIKQVLHYLEHKASDSTADKMAMLQQVKAYLDDIGEEFLPGKAGLLARTEALMVPGGVEAKAADLVALSVFKPGASTEIPVPSATPAPHL